MLSQAPAPFHVIPRGWAGPSLLAMIVFEKFGQHQPLNRQADRYALEGAPSALHHSTPWAQSRRRSIRFDADRACPGGVRLDGDDTTVPMWPRQDRRPALSLSATIDRSAALGANRDLPLRRSSGMIRGAFDRYADTAEASTATKLYLADRKPSPIREAACWVHARAQVLRSRRHRGERAPQGCRKEGDSSLADRHRAGAPHRRAVCHRASINGKSPEERLAVDAPKAGPLSTIS